MFCMNSRVPIQFSHQPCFPGRRFGFVLWRVQHLLWSVRTVLDMRRVECPRVCQCSWVISCSRARDSLAHLWLCIYNTGDTDFLKHLCLHLATPCVQFCVCVCFVVLPVIIHKHPKMSLTRRTGQFTRDLRVHSLFAPNIRAPNCAV